jgi:hypothetical protein
MSSIRTTETSRDGDRSVRYAALSRQCTQSRTQSRCTTAITSKALIAAATLPTSAAQGRGTPRDTVRSMPQLTGDTSRLSLQKPLPHCCADSDQSPSVPACLVDSHATIARATKMCATSRLGPVRQRPSRRHFLSDGRVTYLDLHRKSRASPLAAAVKMLAS